MTEISVELLDRLLIYDPRSGTLTWRDRALDLCASRASQLIWNQKYAGTVAGSVGSDGYIHVRIYRKNCLGHRIAWALRHGEWPKKHVDHINGDRTDNRLCNLRVVSRHENQRNQRLPKSNKSGRIGVRRVGERWHAQIGVSYRRISLGVFNAFEEAAAAREAAERKYGFHPNHGSQGVAA